MSGSNDWFQIYQPNFVAANVVPSVSDVIAVTAASGSTSQSSASIPNYTPATKISNSLSPEGKVSKPVRRRTRTSKRTPTTLLNTDTTNFRAMVQQFTGGPSAPFAVSGMPNLGFGLKQSSPIVVNPSFHLQQQQQLYQQQNHQQQQDQYMFSNNNSNTDHTGRVDFYQRISNTNPTSTTTTFFNNESSMINHGFVMEDHGGGRFFPSSSSS